MQVVLLLVQMVQGPLLMQWGRRFCRIFFGCRVIDFAFRKHFFQPSDISWG